ncbi:Co2+/Mg2+ efflux protein ApaG [Lysobacter sp. HDW10]|jgi:ApaG protein|uniref:Co2+/Mg2+ efflux protein ApaG n=1 Tax=Lysobacter sp. HDW10 TaxID=2714936 RepID=UPI00140C5FCB|nr:Co2+/Mg2+ efflux protein ApaG [Lysobacter sp. HDW10]QIK81189.1 Co2+/Mg2+ efflux protein ApaG [Lysobacter sp. HDW10]
MTQVTHYAMDVSVATEYLDEESSASESRFVFAYTIRIENLGSLPARLLRRHWRITDANGEVEEVHGEGVVGETPWLRPGEGFEYVSGVVLTTHVGTMEGSYDLIADDGTEFAATIPRFMLTVPRTLH